VVGGLGEEFTGEDLSMEEFIKGEENFREGGVGFCSAIKKEKQ